MHLVTYNTIGAVCINNNKAIIKSLIIVNNSYIIICNKNIKNIFIRKYFNFNLI